MSDNGNEQENDDQSQQTFMNYEIRTTIGVFSCRIDQCVVSPTQRLPEETRIEALMHSYSTKGVLTNEKLTGFVVKGYTVERLRELAKTDSPVLPDGCLVEILKGMHRLLAAQRLDGEEKWGGKRILVIVLDRTHAEDQAFTTNRMLTDNDQEWLPKSNSTLDKLVALVQLAEKAKPGDKNDDDGFKTIIRTCVLKEVGVKVDEKDRPAKSSRDLHYWAQAVTDPHLREAILMLVKIPAFRDVASGVITSQGALCNPIILVQTICELCAMWHLITGGHLDMVTGKLIAHCVKGIPNGQVTLSLERLLLQLYKGEWKEKAEKSFGTIDEVRERFKSGVFPMSFRTYALDVGSDRPVGRFTENLTGGLPNASDAVGLARICAILPKTLSAVTGTRQYYKFNGLWNVDIVMAMIILFFCGEHALRTIRTWRNGPAKPSLVYFESRVVYGALQYVFRNAHLGQEVELSPMRTYYDKDTSTKEMREPPSLSRTLENGISRRVTSYIWHNHEALVASVHKTHSLLETAKSPISFDLTSILPYDPEFKAQPDLYKIEGTRVLDYIDQMTTLFNTNPVWWMIPGMICAETDPAKLAVRHLFPPDDPNAARVSYTIHPTLDSVKDSTAALLAEAANIEARDSSKLMYRKDKVAEKVKVLNQMKDKVAMSRSKVQRLDRRIQDIAKRIEDAPDDLEVDKTSARTKLNDEFRRLETRHTTDMEKLNTEQDLAIEEQDEAVQAHDQIVAEVDAALKDIEAPVVPPSHMPTEFLDKVPVPPGAEDILNISRGLPLVSERPPSTKQVYDFKSALNSESRGSMDPPEPTQPSEQVESLVNQYNALYGFSPAHSVIVKFADSLRTHLIDQQKDLELMESERFQLAIGEAMPAVFGFLRKHLAKGDLLKPKPTSGEAERPRREFTPSQTQIRNGQMQLKARHDAILEIIGDDLEMLKSKRSASSDLEDQPLSKVQRSSQRAQSSSQLSETSRVCSPPVDEKSPSLELSDIFNEEAYYSNPGNAGWQEDSGMVLDTPQAKAGPLPEVTSAQLAEEEVMCENQARELRYENDHGRMRPFTVWHPPAAASPKTAYESPASTPEATVPKCPDCGKRNTTCLALRLKPKGIVRCHQLRMGDEMSSDPIESQFTDTVDEDEEIETD